MRISNWRSDVCSSDLLNESQRAALVQTAERMLAANWRPLHPVDIRLSLWLPFRRLYLTVIAGREKRDRARIAELRRRHPLRRVGNILFIGAAAAVFYSLALVVVLLLMSVRSEEHTSELQSLMRLSYAVFCV